MSPHVWYLTKKRARLQPHVLAAGVFNQPSLEVAAAFGQAEGKKKQNGGMDVAPDRDAIGSPLFLIISLCRLNSLSSA